MASGPFPNVSVTTGTTLRQMTEKKPFPKTYSLCVVTFMDGTVHEMTIKASPSIVNHTVKGMHETGFLTLWNDLDSYICSASLVRSVEFRQITTG